MSLLWQISITVSVLAMWYVIFILHNLMKRLLSLIKDTHDLLDSLITDDPLDYAEKSLTDKEKK